MANNADLAADVPWNDPVATMNANMKSLDAGTGSWVGHCRGSFSRKRGIIDRRGLILLLFVKIVCGGSGSVEEGS